MSEEKEVAPDANGKDTKNEEDTNKKELITKESNKDEAKENELDEGNFDLDAEIVRQIEYYFGDVNLPRDKFLAAQVQLDDGWVPLELLIKFHRLSKLTTNIDIIESILKDSNSNILEVADKKVRRNPNCPVPELNEDRRKELSSRTVYAKGFPKNSTLDQLLQFFKKYDVVENIIMRRYLDSRTRMRLFKGSVFATFKTKDQAEKFIAAKDSIKYKNNNLLIMWQNEYVILKQNEKIERHKKKEKKLDKLNQKPSVTSLPSGTVLYFEGGHEKMTREEIKTAFSKLDKKCDIAFIDYRIGLTKGWIRFAEENAAVKFCKLLEDNKIVIGEHSVVLRLLEGDEEKEYLEKTLSEMTKRRKNSKGLKFKGKGFKGKNMKRKTERDNDDEAPPAKVKCNE